jgi:hypothetical protein
MTRDILFLLKHDFADPGGRYYCPECAQITGALTYYPALRHGLDVRYVDFPRPRPEIVEFIGEENQSCPVLILAHAPAAGVPGIEIGENRGRHFISGAHEIGKYLARIHGVGEPH